MFFTANESISEKSLSPLLSSPLGMATLSVLQGSGVIFLDTLNYSRKTCLSGTLFSRVLSIILVQVGISRSCSLANSANKCMITSIIFPPVLFCNCQVYFKSNSAAAACDQTKQWPEENQRSFSGGS